MALRSARTSNARPPESAAHRTATVIAARARTGGMAARRAEPHAIEGRDMKDLRRETPCSTRRREPQPLPRWDRHARALDSRRQPWRKNAAASPPGHAKRIARSIERELSRLGLRCRLWA